LRRVHDALPADTYPFEWSVETRLSSSSLGSSDGFLDVPAWRSDFESVAIKDARLRASQPPPVDKLVVCHGDPCAPNTLIAKNGQPASVGDLGDMGVADRWADLAVATWSTEWNYDPGWQQTLLDG